MLGDLAVTLVEGEDELLEIVPLKQADDSEATKSQIPSELALEKVIRLHEKGHNFWLARLNGQPIGYAVGIGHGDWYQSMGIYVTPDHRGQGIGSELKRAQIDFTRDNGFEGFLSNVDGTNKASKRVLEKSGFRLVPNAGGYSGILKLRE